MRTPVLASALLAPVLLLAACGSSATRTVSVSDTVPSSSVGAAVGGASAPTAPSTKAAGARSSSASGGASAGSGSSTRTQSGPAFASAGPSAGLAGAEGVVRARGYSPVDPPDYRSGQTLGVLVGAARGVQQAFFFVDGRFLGTDTQQPSEQIQVLGQEDTQVILGYTLYRAAGVAAGQARVRYQLDNGRLMALDPIPGTGTDAGPGRR